MLVISKPIAIFVIYFTKLYKKASGNSSFYNCGAAKRQYGVGLAVNRSSRSWLAAGGSSRSRLVTGRVIKVGWL